jgi:3-deoxy-manno-octulosonate cytidylyltransferase (CMP-KDO synthetase)
LAIVAIIPARFASTRLPGKPLSDILGKPMIQHVYERVARAHVDRVLVATDDQRILHAVAAFGGQAVMTSPMHPSGTDRVAEVARSLPAKIIVNVQGDEPLLDPRHVDLALEPLARDATVAISTLASPIDDLDDLLAPSVVKVVLDGRGDALYFSRSPIPHLRQDASPSMPEAALPRGLALRHIGLYAYRREALLRLAALPPAALEQAECLEQLRALHDGLRIRVVRLDETPAPAVDTPQDLARVRALMEAGHGR